jgi:hypothetical protein
MSIEIDEFVPQELGNEYINPNDGDFIISGLGSFGSLSVSGDSTFGGDVGIGTTNPISKLHVVGDTLIEQNFYVSGISTFIGNVDFRGGTNGNIIFGDTSGDNVIFNADVNSNIIPHITNTYDLGSTTQRWRDGHFAGTVNTGFVTATSGFVGVLTATRINSGFTTTTNLFVGTAATIGFVTATSGFVGVLTATRITSSGINVVGVITATSFNGNATTATNLTGNGTNWSSNGRITAVVGELAWKNFGNNHTIFDASAGTAPNWGVNANKAISNTNSEIVWSATYPTLMGWNGASTYGVRVDSARNANLLDGLNAATTGANTIVRTDGSGRIQVSKAVHTSGASDYFLELVAPDSGASTGEVSIKMHQGNRWWGQIRLRSDGFHFTQGDTNTYRDISAGNINATTGVRINTTGDSSVGSLSFIKSGISRGDISYRHNATGTSERLVFNVSGTEHLSILGTGSVGVGIANPESLLHLRSAATSAPINLLYLNNPTTASASAGVRIALSANENLLAQDRHAYIGALTSVLGGNGNHLVFATNETGDTPVERVRITSDGTLRLLSSPGIDFSQIQTNAAGMTSETLDSYEEGTFTPTVIGTGTAGTGTYQAQVGRYTKIGDVVRFSIFVAWNAHTGAGNMRLAGLPFTALNVDNSSACFSILPTNLTFSNNLAAIGVQNSTQVNLLTYSSNATNVALPIDTTGSIRVSGVYEVV